MEARGGVATTGDSANEFEDLGSSSMARQFGKRMYEKLVPRFFPNASAFQRAMGFAYSTVHDWKTGNADPELATVVEVAEKVKTATGVEIDPPELLTDRPLPDNEVHIVPDERYPNRGRVLALLGAACEPEAVRRVASLELHAATDPDVLWWVRRLLNEDDRARMDRADPARVEQREAASRVVVARHLADHAARTGTTPDDEEPPPPGSPAAQRLAKETETARLAMKGAEVEHAEELERQRRERAKPPPDDTAKPGTMRTHAEMPKAHRDAINAQKRGHRPKKKGGGK